MENSKFTYVIEPGNDNGYVHIYEGERKRKRQGLLYFTETAKLITSLEIYKKSAVIVYDDSKALIEEGVRLAKKLNLEFQHP